MSEKIKPPQTVDQVDLGWNCSPRDVVDMAVEWAQRQTEWPSDRDAQVHLLGWYLDDKFSQYGIGEEFNPESGRWEVPAEDFGTLIHAILDKLAC